MNRSNQQKKMREKRRGIDFETIVGMGEGYHRRNTLGYSLLVWVAVCHHDVTRRPSYLFVTTAFDRYMTDSFCLYAERGKSINRTINHFL